MKHVAQKVKSWGVSVVSWFWSRSKKKKLFLIIVLAVLILVISRSVNDSGKPKYEVATAERGDVTQVVSEIGSIVSVGRTNIFSQALELLKRYS